jgi:hypothetical protein
MLLYMYYYHLLCVSTTNIMLLLIVPNTTTNITSTTITTNTTTTTLLLLLRILLLWILLRILAVLVGVNEGEEGEGVNLYFVQNVTRTERSDYEYHYHNATNRSRVERKNALAGTDLDWHPAINAVVGATVHGYASVMVLNAPVPPRRQLDTSVGLWPFNGGSWRLLLWCRGWDHRKRTYTADYRAAEQQRDRSLTTFWLGLPRAMIMNRFVYRSLWR